MSEERWSADFDSKTMAWCHSIAALGADALIHAGVLERADFERAVDVLAEELYARLAVRDYPPNPSPSERDESA